MDWVQQGRATFRWTGSWLTLFASADQKSATGLTEQQRIEISRQLDRFRLAGRETYRVAPVYADLDFEIVVCVEPTAYRGETKQGVLDVLFGAKGVGEPAIISVVPTITNAIYHATGLRFSSLPIRPWEMHKALKEARK